MLRQRSLSCCLVVVLLRHALASGAVDTVSIFAGEVGRPTASESGNGVAHTCLLDSEMLSVMQLAAEHIHRPPQQSPSAKSSHHANRSTASLPVLVNRAAGQEHGSQDASSFAATSSNLTAQVLSARAIADVSHTAPLREHILANASAEGLRGSPASYARNSSLPTGLHTVHLDARAFLTRERGLFRPFWTYWSDNLIAVPFVLAFIFVGLIMIAAVGCPDGPLSWMGQKAMVLSTGGEALEVPHDLRY